MPRANRHQNKFSAALRSAREAHGLTQEAFDLASSRTYVSSLERGLKSPTLKKVDELAEVIGIHPLTLLTLSYVRDLEKGSGASVLKAVAAEVDAILDAS